jgi:hypothetical protein
MKVSSLLYTIYNDSLFQTSFGKDLKSHQMKTTNFINLLCIPPTDDVSLRNRNTRYNVLVVRIVRNNICITVNAIKFQSHI